jgi:perosamine synthetase
MSARGWEIVGSMSRSPHEPARASFTCRPSDSVFLAIEKCLDNGTGTCLVLDEGERLVGRVDLDGLRSALRDGLLLGDSGIARLIAAHPAANDEIKAPARGAPPPSSVLGCVVDDDGRLVEVAVDRAAEFIPIACPDLSHREFRLLLDAFLSTWISSTGSYVQRLQEAFAAFVGRRHAIAVMNGTAALHLALAALGIGPGDEVIVPDLTFAATINAVLHCGATPVIVDIDPLNWGLSPEAAARALTPRTKAILPVHLYGRPAEIGLLAGFARAHGLFLIEDCAEAPGARYAGRPVGQFGEVGCFSFFANKILTTGEGGICVTDSDELAARLGELRDHGMAPGRRYWHERVGYNYRMTNLQAALGVAQLGRFDELFQRRQRLEQLYREALGDLPGVIFPGPLPNHIEPAVWLVSLQVPAGKRDGLIEAGRRAGLELRPFFHPLSDMPPYRCYGGDCPASRALSETGLNLPTSSAVDATVIARMRAVFQEALA